MMVTYHKASLWPHAVGDCLDPSIREEDGVLAGNLVDMIGHYDNYHIQTLIISPELHHSAPAG